jgi:4-hydroxymandelate oxidase
MSRFTRRRALGSLGSWLAASPLVQGQELIGEPPGRIAPRAELVNLFEVEAMAKRKLPGAVYSTIAGGDRKAFDRMTFRPRMLIDVQKLDLSTALFGETLFAPILVGPIADQQQFHPEGELAAARGAAAAKTLMVVSSRSSQPIEKIAAEAKTGLWYQVYPEPDMLAVRARVHQAVQAGCKAVCLTVGAPLRPPQTKIDWSTIDQLRKGLTVPFLLKGIMSPEEAQAAIRNGVQGLVVSNHGDLLSNGLAAPIEMLPSIADAVGGKAPILIDGSFRRGTDVLKALALGAQAVMIGRPVMWGLGAYGADGVQTVLGMLQSELARSMGLAGRPNIKAIDRGLVKIHLR